jgi:hypothetical protein
MFTYFVCETAVTRFVTPKKRLVNEDVSLSSFFRLLKRDGEKTARSEEKTAKKASFEAIIKKILYVCRQKEVFFYISLFKRRKKRIISKR